MHLILLTMFEKFTIFYFFLVFMNSYENYILNIRNIKVLVYNTLKCNNILVLKLRGGGKKRKKKNFTKPKKNKHFKKKISLRYLNYYYLNEGKIEKLRKISPESPGCFMAEHIDRITCGKSGLTYIRT